MSAMGQFRTSKLSRRYGRHRFVEAWRRHYNALRPHSSLGYRPPAPEAPVSSLPPAAHLRFEFTRSAPTGSKYPLIKSANRSSDHGLNHFPPALVQVSAMAPLDLPNRPRNRLLALLPASDYDLLQPHLEPVQLTYRRSLYQANRPISSVYFFEFGRGLAGQHHEKWRCLRSWYDRQ